MEFQARLEHHTIHVHGRSMLWRAWKSYGYEGSHSMAQNKSQALVELTARDISTAQHPHLPIQEILLNTRQEQPRPKTIPRSPALEPST